MRWATPICRELLQHVAIFGRTVADDEQPGRAGVRQFRHGFYQQVEALLMGQATHGNQQRPTPGFGVHEGVIKRLASQLADSLQIDAIGDASHRCSDMGIGDFVRQLP